MRRWAFTVILFLLLGAIVNVAVAWAIAIWMPVSSGGQRMGDTRPWPLPPPEPSWPDNPLVEYRSGGRFIERVDLRVTTDTPESIDRQREAAIRYNNRVGQAMLANLEFIREARERGMFWMEAVAAGCPCWTLRGARVWTPKHGSDAMHWALDWPLDQPTATSRDWRLLPLRPIWPGFAINTLFYAAILWMPFGAFALRRWRRIKRGLCPKCAYPVGTSTVCTECGKALVCKRVLPR